MVEKQVAEVARAAKLRFWSQADGSLVVGAWRRSGEKQAHFARRYGINAQRLSWWIKREERAQPAPVRFHPVRMTGRLSVERSGDDRLEIRLGEGRSVQVPAGFAAEALERVLQLLEGRA